MRPLIGSTIGSPAQFAVQRQVDPSGATWCARLSELPVYLVMKNIPDREWSYSLIGPRRIIGRSFRADIRIPERYHFVSRRHAEVWADQEAVWLKDCGSKLGSNLNGVWLDNVPKAQLVAGDTLWLGGLELDVVPQVVVLADMPRLASAGDSDETVLPLAAPPHRKLMRALSPAELEILLWMSRGIFDKLALGVRLNRSPHTVRTQLDSIYRKLNVHSRTEIVGLLRHSSHLRGTIPLQDAPVPEPD